MRNGLLVLIGAVSVCACGGSPASPTTAATSLPTIRAGEYVVTIMANPWSSTSPGICGGVTVNGALPPGDTATFTAVVASAGDAFTLRPSGAADLGLLATLKPVGAGMIAGAGSGQARDLDSNVMIGVSSGPAAPGTAPSEPTFVGYNTFTAEPNVFSGPIAGVVSLSNTGGTRTCASGSWTMRPK